MLLLPLRWYRYAPMALEGNPSFESQVENAVCEYCECRWSDEGATAYCASKVICCKLTHLNLPLTL